MSSRTGGGPIRRGSGKLAAGRASAEGGGTFSAPELHGPQHEMHLAIERSIGTTNFEDVQKLLDKGETFCRGDGLNCFILAIRNLTDEKDDLARRWDLLMKMIQVDSRGILARDQDGRTLLNYIKDVNKMKQLIELGADLNNVDNAGKNLVQSLFGSDDEINRFPFCTEGKVWEMLLEHKEIQNQVSKSDFLDQLLLTSMDEMICIFIEQGIMSVEELTTKLKMHPLFYLIELNSSESLQLLLYILSDDTRRNENVSALGADLNIVNQNGKSVFECLFSPDALEMIEDESTAMSVSELWDSLIERSEIQNQVLKEGYIRSLAPQAEVSTVVRDIIDDIFQLGICSDEKLTSELGMHPLLFALKVAERDMHNILIKMTSYPSSFFEDKTILITRNISERYDKHFPGWQRIKCLLNLPDVLTFDVFGYIFFNLHSLHFYNRYKGSEETRRIIFQGLTTLLEYGFVPSQAAGVVHPIHALLYNIFINSWTAICPPSAYTFRGYFFQDNLLSILQKAITTFKDYPIPHKLVQDPETGALVLDVHLLISSMLNPFMMNEEETPLEFIMAMLQLSPCHPLQHFATFYKYSSCYFQDDRHKGSFLETFSKLLLLALDASGKHSFQAVDQATIDCYNHFCDNIVELFHPDSEDEDEEISLQRKASVHAKSELSSLKWFCILQIRKTLFLSMSSTTVTLPSLIRGLVAERYLPKGLEADVLVYKPNSCINF